MKSSQRLVKVAHYGSDHAIASVFINKIIWAGFSEVTFTINHIYNELVKRNILVLFSKRILESCQPLP